MRRTGAARRLWNRAALRVPAGHRAHLVALGLIVLLATALRLGDLDGESVWIVEVLTAERAEN